LLGVRYTISRAAGLYRGEDLRISWPRRSRIWMPNSGDQNDHRPNFLTAL
jgi:hypothetical protein